MKYMEGLTINEMAEKLKISPNTVKQRLFQRGIKPFCKSALYELSALEQISDFGPKGFQSEDNPSKKRPKKKPPEPQPAKTEKKTKKTRKPKNKKTSN